MAFIICALIFRDFRLSLRCEWHFRTNVSGQSIGLVFKG